MNRKRVERLMPAMELRAIYRRPSTNRRSPEHPVHPCLLRNVRITRLTKACPSEGRGADSSQVGSSPQVLKDRGGRMGMDGKGGWCYGTIFVERLWRTVKYEGVHLKAYASVLEARRELEDYFGLYNGLGPHEALGYRTPAGVFHKKEEGALDEDSMEGGIHRKREPNLRQKSRDSRLTQP